MRNFVFVFVLIATLSGSPSQAAQPVTRLTRDVAVGTALNVHLKAGQVVQILNQTGATAVISVQLPDGSHGVYQIDATAIEMVAAAALAPKPPSPPTGARPANTNIVPVPHGAAMPVATMPAVAPAYPPDFAGGPEFNTTAGRQAAGTASIVKLKGGTQSYIVSARHLLGPDGGFKTQAAAADVPAFVKSIRMEFFAGGSRQYNVTGLLVPAGQLKADGGDPIDDMAIYKTHDPKARSEAVALADEVPAVGTPVWVVAQVRGGVPPGQIMQSGRVTSNEKWIIIQFDNDGIITAGASGAPVLNTAGEVIGVYSGHNRKNGHVFGFIIPAPLMVKTIKQKAPAAR